MGFFRILALSLLLSPALFAASPFEMFLHRSFEPDSGVQYVSLLSNGGYYLVSAGGVETYVVDASNGSIVDGIPALTALLEQDAKNRDSFDSKLSSAIAFPSQANAAKQANESKCLQYIGDDGDPGCTDKQTCIVSCYSSPQCSLIIQAGGFIEAMMGWDDGRKAYSSLLSAYSDGIDSIRADPAQIDRKISILQNLSALASNLTQSTLFLTKDDPGCSGKNATLRCYEYCPKIDYSSSLISSEIQGLASLKLTLSKVANQRARAEAIVESGAENDAYLSSRGRDYENFRLKMLNGIRSLKAQSAELAETVNDSSIAPMISGLENISALSQNLSGAGNYRQALALRQQFDSLSNNASAAIGSDGKRYSALVQAMNGYSDKVASSAWLIGNASASAHLSQLASLKANYTAPLTPAKISDASAALSGLSAALDAEISSKAVSAGNSSAPPPSPPSSQPLLPCLPALILPPALIFAFARGRRRV
ncbi:MAG: hypothetical protein NTX79_00040 [Candidatus Micrarchaeota archaeon]|nr:hypothetical protein [Candidatus Micrarchaeota archaeon]